MMSWTSLGRYFQSRPLVSAVPGELQTDILSKSLPPWTADTRWTPDAPKRFTSTPDLLTRLLLSHCDLTNIDARQAAGQVSATPTECAQLGQVWSPVRALPPGQGPASTRYSTRTRIFLSYSNSTRTKHYSDRVVSSINSRNFRIIVKRSGLNEHQIWGGHFLFLLNLETKAYLL